MMRLLRNYVLPLGILVGVLAPSPALATDGNPGPPRQGAKGGHRIYLNPETNEYEPEICYTEEYKCTRTKVWYDDEGIKHVKPGKCRTVRVPYYC